MRDLYPSNTAEYIASVIGRSAKSVWRRAGLLGLKKSREWIAETARERNSRPGHGGSGSGFIAASGGKLLPGRSVTEPTANGIKIVTMLENGATITRHKAS